MAYIVDYAITENAAAGATSVVANVPDHIANDYLIMFGSVNGAGIPSVSGWTQIGSTQSANSSGITSAVWYFKATTSTTTVTVAISAADDYTIKIVSVRDADLTTFLDGTPISTNTATTATSEFTSPTMTTALSGSLVICYHAFDGVTPMAHSDAGGMFLVSSDSTGTTAATSAGSAIAWTVQATAGTTFAMPWSLNISTQRTNHVFAIRNKSGGSIPAYMDTATTLATRVHSGLHTGTLNNTVVTTTMTATASINGKTMATSTATLGADFGINPYSSAIGNTSAVRATGTLGGYQITLTGNRNWSTGLIIGSYIARTPKEARYGIGSTKQGGLVVRLGSGASNWCAYQVGAKDALQTLETRSLFAIEAGNTATSYGTPGSAVTTTAVSFIQFYYNAPLFASIAYLTDLYQVFNTVVAGGDSVTPVNLEGLTAVGNSYRLPLIRKTGSSVLSYTPIKIGGNAAVNFQVDLGTIQFPGRYNASSGDLSYHASNNKLGIDFAGKTGDTIKLTNSVVTSPVSYFFSINSAATSAATWDFAGTTVVGANVSLRPVTTYSSMTFSGATGFSTNASVFSDTTISSSVTVAAAGATFTRCAFSSTVSSSGAVSITGATQGALQTELDKFVDCTWNTNTVGPALVINYTGTGNVSLSMTSGTFTSNTTAIRWIPTNNVNLTINLSGTANPATWSSTQGTVTFINAKTFSVSNLILNSELRIYLASDLTELAGCENTNTTGTPTQSLNNVSILADPDNAGRYIATYSYNYTVDTPVVIVVLNNQYQALRTTATLKATSQTVPVNQIFDRQYVNP